MRAYADKRRCAIRWRPKRVGVYAPCRRNAWLATMPAVADAAAHSSLPPVCCPDAAFATRVRFFILLRRRCALPLLRCRLFTPPCLPRYMPRRLRRSMMSLEVADYVSSHFRCFTRARLRVRAFTRRLRYDVRYNIHDACRIHDTDVRHAMVGSSPALCQSILRCRFV